MFKTLLHFLLTITILSFPHCRKEKRIVDPQKEALKLEWEIKGERALNDNRVKAAFKAFDNYLKLSLEEGNLKDTAQANLKLAMLNSRLKKYNIANKRFHKAIELFEEADYSYGIGESYNYLGKSFFNQNQLDMALSNFEKAKEIFTEAGTSKNLYDKQQAQFALGLVHSNFALLYKKKKEYPEVLNHLNKSKEWQEKLVSPAYLVQDEEASELNKGEIFYLDTLTVTYNDIALTLVHLKKYSEAIKYYKKAIYIAKMTNHFSHLAVYYNNFGEVLARAGYFNKALDNFNEALKIEKEINSPYQKLTEENLQKLEELKIKLINEGKLKP